MSRHYFGLNRATVNFEQGSAKSELHQGQKKKKKVYNCINTDTGTKFHKTSKIKHA